MRRVRFELDIDDGKERKRYRVLSFGRPSHWFMLGQLSDSGDLSGVKYSLRYDPRLPELFRCNCDGFQFGGQTCRHVLALRSVAAVMGLVPRKEELA